MTDPDPLLDPSELRARTLSRWDNKGGAIAAAADETHPDVPRKMNTELVLPRVRVIALENLLLAVLAEGSEQQRQAARELALPSIPSRFGRPST